MPLTKLQRNVQPSTTRAILWMAPPVYSIATNTFRLGENPLDYLSRAVTKFPLSSSVSIKESSVSKLGSVCRRVYRIFSHAYFHHRRIFNEFEEENSLCLRFTHFVTKYNLMSKDNLIVPISDNALGEVPGESEA